MSSTRWRAASRSVSGGELQNRITSMSPKISSSAGASSCVIQRRSTRAAAIVGSRSPQANDMKPRLCAGWDAVEEVHFAALERILGADDEQSFLAHQPLEDVGAVAEVVRGHAHVGAHRRLDECVRSVRPPHAQNAFDRWTDAIDDRAD